MTEFKNLITLTQVSDGAPGAPGRDGLGYYVKTNQEEMLCFYTSEGLDISPKLLEITLHKLPDINTAIDFQNNYNFGYIDSEGKFVSLIGDEFLDYYSFGIQEQDKIAKPLTLIYDFPALVKNNEVVKQAIINSLLRFSFLENGEEVLIKVIPFREGLSPEMAQFNVTATNINAAVDGSFLVFEKTGLKVYGAGLSIYNNKDSIEPAFFADNSGDLHIKGVIEATGGSFTGAVHATWADFDGGEIGGFNIKANELSNQNKTLILNGKEGFIYAENIQIGKGASISEYIALGNARIYNPNHEDANGAILVSGGIRINDDGNASFGNIEIDGNNSVIRGQNWSISPDRANFSNITISGAIETAVFKTGAVQAAGSAMIFSPSYKIESIENGIITIKEKIDIDIDSIIWLVTTEGKHDEFRVAESTQEDNLTKIKLKENINASYVAIIIIGKEDSMILGVNGGSAKIANLVYGKGLTITSHNNQNTPNLFLGDLSSLGIKEYSGYGLFADNVYLKGSLTTQAGLHSYAGINTLNGVQAIAFEDDNSKIIFWAGSDSPDDKDIKKAPFQVTEEGSIYASRANLTNSLIVGGIITGTDIYTARIHGTGQNSEPALSIYDTSGGISFRSNYEQDNQGVETFLINNQGFKAKGNWFINILENGLASFCGQEFKTNGSRYISLAVKDQVPVLYHSHSDKQSCGFYFEEGKTTYKFSTEGKDMVKTIWTNNEVKLIGAIGFGKNEDNINLSYRPVEGGYDLYIIE